MAAGPICDLCGCGHFRGDPCMESCTSDDCPNAEGRKHGRPTPPTEREEREELNRAPAEAHEGVPSQYAVAVDYAFRLGVSAGLRTHSPEEPVGYVVIRHDLRGMAFDTHDFPVERDAAEVVARSKNERERRAAESAHATAVTHWRVHPIGQPLDSGEGER